MTDVPAAAATEPHAAAHIFPVRVYYEDTDAWGVVYHANYLRFAERARTELLRELGFDHVGLRESHGLAFAVRRCTADYLRPAHLDDALEVHTSIAEVGGASTRMIQTIKREGEDLAVLELLLVCMGGNGKAVRIPDDVRRCMSGYEVKTAIGE